jgi:hypothetical protein
MAVFILPPVREIVGMIFPWLLILAYLAWQIQNAVESGLKAYRKRKARGNAPAGVIINQEAADALDEEVRWSNRIALPGLSCRGGGALIWWLSSGWLADLAAATALIGICLSFWASVFTS